MITEQKGPWMAEARLTAWDEVGDGIVTLTRNGEHVGTFTVYRFPIGWRSGALLRSSIPATGKAVGARAVKRLP